jgi:hypothetical protein
MMNDDRYYAVFEPPPPTGELWTGFVMRKKPKKDRLEKTEYVKYMYYANSSDDKTVEVLDNECSRLNKEAGSRILKEVKPEDLPDLKFKFEDK